MKIEEKLEIIKDFDYTCTDYANEDLKKVEIFFETKNLIIQWFEYSYSKNTANFINISKDNILKSRELAAKKDIDYHLFLYYMMQNNMLNEIKYYLEPYDDKYILEKNFLPYLAQTYTNLKLHNDAYSKFKMLNSKFEDNKYFKLGLFHSAKNSGNKEYDLELPSCTASDLFNYLKKTPEDIDKIKKLGYKKAINKLILIGHIFYGSFTIIFFSLIIFLLLPTSFYPSYIAYLSIFLRIIFSLIIFNYFRLKIKKRKVVKNEL